MSRPFRRRPSQTLSPERSAPPRYPRLAARSADGDEAVVLELVNYEITDEPLDDPRMARLSQQDQDRILRAGARVMEGATEQVSVLERLVELFPDVPKVYNFLMGAYNNAGQYAKAEEWAEKAYRRFPEYFFGMVNYVHALLRRGLIREVEEILNHRFSIHLWIRDRRCYHLSEFLAFNSLMARYFALVGKDEVAKSYYRMMCDVAPDHPVTRQIGACLADGLLKSVLGPLSKSRAFSRSGK